jgi:iron donor protein CyaY
MFPAGQKIVINTQRPWRQIWVASPLGAAHFSQQGETWFSERDDLDLGTLLSRWVSQFLQRDCLIRVANLR